MSHKLVKINVFNFLFRIWFFHLPCCWCSYCFVKIIQQPQHLKPREKTLQNFFFWPKDRFHFSPRITVWPKLWNPATSLWLEFSYLVVWNILFCKGNCPICHMWLEMFFLCLWLVVAFFILILRFWKAVGTPTSEMATAFVIRVILIQIFTIIIIIIIIGGGCLYVIPI